VNRCVLDTDILIEFFRRNAAVIGQVAAYLQEYEQLSITIITYYEVLRGLRYVNVERQLNALKNFVVDNEVLPLDELAIDQAADVYAALRKNGQLIGEGDILIAGIALAHRRVLVTNNTAHYSRVPGLQLENWVKA